MSTAETLISDMIGKSAAMDARKTDTVVAPVDMRWFGRSVSFGSQGAEVVWGNSGTQSPIYFTTPMPLKLHAFRQVCTKLGTALWQGGAQRSLPVEFLLVLPNEIVGSNLNYATETYANIFPKRRWLWREYAEEPQEGVSVDSIRAVMDGAYPAISNTELLQNASEMIENMDYRLVRPHLTADEMNVRIALRNVGEHYAVGVYIGNSEIGTSKIRILPFIQRHSCTNSIVSVDGGVELVHRGDIHALRVQAIAAMSQSLHATGAMLERMVAAEKELIPNFQSVLRGLSLQYGWNEEISTAVILGTEAQTTRAGVVNGITYAAHKVLNGTAQADMEILGGAILAAPNSLFERAARLSERTTERSWRRSAATSAPVVELEN